MSQDVGPWQGPDLETWLARIAAPILREGETLPLVKPFPAAPVEEEAAGAAINPEYDGWAEAELREIYGR